jgi:hypothetical protein
MPCPPDILELGRATWTLLHRCGLKPAGAAGVLSASAEQPAVVATSTLTRSLTTVHTRTPQCGGILPRVTQ